MIGIRLVEHGRRPGKIPVHRHPRQNPDRVTLRPANRSVLEIPAGRIEYTLIENIEDGRLATVRKCLDASLAEQPLVHMLGKTDYVERATAEQLVAEAVFALRRYVKELGITGVHIDGDIVPFPRSPETIACPTLMLRAEAQSNGNLNRLAQEMTSNGGLPSLVRNYLRLTD